VRVLAYTSPARGHLFGLVPILDELARRGHAIAVRTLAAGVGPLARRGFAAAPIAPAIERLAHDDHRARTPVGGLRRSMATFARRAPLEVEDLRTAIAATAPDVLLVDAMTFGAAAVAEADGRPWAQWMPYPMPLSSPVVPPFAPGLAPARGLPGRVRDRALRPVLARAYRSAALPALGAVRSAVGVAPYTSTDDLFTRSPLLLYLTAEPFEYPRPDWPASVVAVGPCAWDPPAEPPAWLGELRRPLVLVSTSSEFQDDAALARAALDGLAGEDVDVVVTMPSAALDGPVPENARVEPFVAHAPILLRAACAVTHGGAGVTQKALAAGVPVCAVPFGRDQFEVARRVEVAGAGTRLPARRLTPARLRACVREAIRRRAGAERVAAGFARAGGAPRAADAVEALAGGAYTASASAAARSTTAR